MVDTIKFSQMTDGGDIKNNEKVPGLLGGANVLFNNPWTFLAPGTTAERPTPAAEMYYRLRLNTDTQLYEYYDVILTAWVSLSQSLFVNGPFITYTADASLPDAQNLGLLANGLLKQTVTSASATLDIALQGTDYYGPGDTPTFAGMTLTGNLNMGGFTAANAANPVNPQDYATKFYVDQVSLTGTSVYAASAASLGTVTQVGSGPGATLTNSGVQAVLALDGVNPPVGANVLIKNTATGMTSANEGIYTVTNVGSASTNWSMIRAANFDTAPQVNTTGLIVIQNGSTLAGTGWYNTTTIVTMDVTAFNFAQFGTGGTVTSVGTGTGLTGGPITTTGTISFAAIAANSFWANITGGSAVPTVQSFPLTLTLGGSNASLTASNGGIVYSTASAMAILAGTATAGLALLSGATGAPHWSTFKPITSVVVQTITSTGTYTANAALVFANTQIMGGGGGSGGCASASGLISAAAGGGGAAPLTSGWFTAAQVGTGGSVTIGAGGAAATAGANNGGTGGTSTLTLNGVGTLAITSSGGVGGGGDSTGVTAGGGLGGAGGSQTGGTLGSVGCGASGGNGTKSGVLFSCGGKGADSQWGAGGISQSVNNGSGNGNAGVGFGSGASGAVCAQAGVTNLAGTIGRPGCLVVVEYISS